MANRLIWIVVTLVIALYGIFQRPLVLGLDLQGGVTMRYALEPPDSARPDDDVSGMIDTTVDTLRNRINTYGIKESSITRQGDREIVIELPGYGKEEAETIKSVIARVGNLQFRIVLRRDGSDDDARNGVVVATEVQRLRDLLAKEENRGKAPDELSVRELDIEAPDVRYRWYAYANKILAEHRGAVLSPETTLAALLAQQPLTERDFELVRLEFASSRTFTGGDIAGARQDVDRRQTPAVGIDIRADRASEFGDWTEPNKGRLMAMLLDDRVAEPPAAIQDRLEGRFIIISGSPTGFTSAEIKDYLTVIKSGSLQMKPRLLSGTTVGPSLGESAIQAGISASLAGLVATLLFLVGYYRLHGLIAVTTLTVNMVLLTGILMVLGATLTLPGIAGLVLTLGMAVDANILIFERFREEADRSKSMPQAIKLGFEKALSAIIDSNVTTFVTAAILYKMGSGPVRGFAVTLMLGLLTSVFSVIVVGRALYDFLVAKGFQSTRMGRLLKEQTAFPFMRTARVAWKISLVAVVAGVVGFLLADRDKYGLDFLGGYKARVVLARSATQGEVKTAVASAFPGAQVVSVLDEAAGPGRSQQFVVKVKAQPGTLLDENLDLEDVYERPLKAALAGLILPDFAAGVVLQEDTAAVATHGTANLHFLTGESVPRATPERVAARLGFLSDVTAKAASDGAVAIAGTWARTGVDTQEFVQRLRLALDGAPDLPPASEPFAESTTIGSQVGTQLRDSALQALVLSFVAIVLYIRVRFREYRYGLAAIIAVAHDVAVTLGIVVLVHGLGLVDAELDLVMIAAFLTIIGYSLNDTIVLFDRVRENLPRLGGKSLEEVLDISMNQVLARTLLTSSTTLVALFAIFLFNYGRQNMLEGFSFAMLVGVIVGTYSSIYVASPVLVMLARRGGPHADASSSEPRSGRGRPREQAQGVPA